jgi:hypothetical protein
MKKIINLTLFVFLLLVKPQISLSLSPSLSANPSAVTYVCHKITLNVNHIEAYLSDSDLNRYYEISGTIPSPIQVSYGSSLQLVNQGNWSSLNNIPNNSTVTLQVYLPASPSFSEVETFRTLKAEARVSKLLGQKLFVQLCKIINASSTPTSSNNNVFIINTSDIYDVGNFQ